MPKRKSYQSTFLPLYSRQNHISQFWLKKNNMKFVEFNGSLVLYPFLLLLLLIVITSQYISFSPFSFSPTFSNHNNQVISHFFFYHNYNLYMIFAFFFGLNKFVFCRSIEATTLAEQKIVWVELEQPFVGHLKYTNMYH